LKNWPVKQKLIIVVVVVVLLVSGSSNGGDSSFGSVSDNVLTLLAEHIQEACRKSYIRDI